MFLEIKDFLKPEEVARLTELLAEPQRLKLPRHVAEALLTFLARNSASANVRRWPIEPELAQRFQRFGNALKQHRSPAEAESSMGRDFGDTYWFYETFGQSAAWAELCKKGAR